MVLAPTVVLTSLVWLRDNAEFTETEVLEKIADRVAMTRKTCKDVFERLFLLLSVTLASTAVVAR